MPIKSCNVREQDLQRLQVPFISAALARISQGNPKTLENSFGLKHDVSGPSLQLQLAYCCAWSARPTKRRWSRAFILYRRSHDHSIGHDRVKNLFNNRRYLFSCRQVSPCYNDFNNHASPTFGFFGSAFDFPNATA